MPAGFTAERIATVRRARELAVAPNGDLFVGTNGDAIYVVPDAQGTAGAPRAFATFPDSEMAGVFLAGDTLYAGGEFGVYRVPYRSGDREAREKPQKIASVRSGGGTGHSTTTVVESKGTVYASVGSSCNACDETDPTRATVQAMSPDGKNMHARAVDIRNAIALAVQPATGDVGPASRGATTSSTGTRTRSSTRSPRTRARRTTAGRNATTTASRSAARAARTSPCPRSCSRRTTRRSARRFTRGPERRARVSGELSRRRVRVAARLGHQPPVAPRVAFVAFRGNDPAKGVDWSNPEAQWTEFVGGCQSADGGARRPAGVAVGTDGSLFVSDDATGAIWRIRPARK